METTLKIAADDVLAAARSLARCEGRTLGEVVSDLARRGLQQRPRANTKPSGFPIFEVDADAATITPRMVGEAMDEGNR